MLAFNRMANRPDYMRVDLMREWLVDLGDVGDDEEEKHLKVRQTKCSSLLQDWGKHAFKKIHNSVIHLMSYDDTLSVSSPTRQGMIQW